MVLNILIRKPVIELREAAFIVQQYIWIRKQKKINIIFSGDIFSLVDEYQGLIEAANWASCWFLQEGY